MNIFLTACVILLTINATHSKMSEELLPQLEKGETILQKEKVETSAWPKIHIYQIVDASPLESLAIFLALDHQKNYLPAVIVSRPIKHISATEVLTEYELELPWPLTNTTYTHGSNFKKENDKHYQANWYMVESESTEKVEGYAIFKEYKGKTLMEYHNAVKPKSIFAGIVRDMMIKDTKASLLAIKIEIERAKKKDPTLLKKYIGFIEKSLLGEKVYSPIFKKK
ncbi:hypothetical protein A9Q84_11510 [Halobacteriovorax marinus]|uniref:Ribosome association toxin RatA n=1 Tax=Halobacteriovorax marinus TaxID=97084 RepID=A0A1Y5F7P9_9BACT|nr:hypothetical protein A9Q84_11510 [Halobacteriovorax marinus]